MTYPIPTITGAPNYAYVGPVSGILSQALSSTQVLVLVSATDRGYNQGTVTVTGTSWSITNMNAGYKIAVVYDSLANKFLSTSEATKEFSLDYIIQSYQTTDLDYYEFSTPAFDDGTYQTTFILDYLSSPSDLNNPAIQTCPLRSSGFSTGEWSTRLATFTGTQLAYTIPVFGLIRSYLIPITDPSYAILSTRCYVYDLATACIAFLGIDSTWADHFALGLINAQDPITKYWYFSMGWTNAVPPDPYLRNGAMAWCLYALALYCHIYPSGTYVTQAKAAITSGMTAILAFQVASGPQAGLVTLGLGAYVGGTFEPGTTNPVVLQASAEHNIDLYFALKYANIVLPSGGYATPLAAVQAGLASLWGKNPFDTGNPTFAQGVSPAGLYDDADALDISTWGGLYQLAIGNTANAISAWNHAQGFLMSLQHISGYTPYLPGRGYPDAIPNVWSEGTFGAATLANRLFGATQSDAIVSAVASARGPDNGWKYAYLYDVQEEVADWEAVAGTAWASYYQSSTMKNLILA